MTHWTRLKLDVTSWFTQTLEVEGTIGPVWRTFLVVELVQSNYALPRVISINVLNHHLWLLLAVL